MQTSIHTINLIFEIDADTRPLTIQSNNFSQFYDILTVLLEFLIIVAVIIDFATLFDGLQLFSSTLFFT